MVQKDFRLCLQKCKGGETVNNGTHTVIPLKYKEVRNGEILLCLSLTTTYHKKCAVQSNGAKILVSKL
jgi:hypothetical protein